MTEENGTFTPAEAVEYLRKNRGIIYSIASLRGLRRYKRAETKRVYPNYSLWTKAELDAIVPSRKTKRVEGWTGPDDEEEEGRSSSVTYAPPFSAQNYSEAALGATA